MDQKRMIEKAVALVLAGMKEAAMRGKASRFAPKEVESPDEDASESPNAEALEMTDKQEAPEESPVGGDVSEMTDSKGEPDEDELEALLGR